MRDLGLPRLSSTKSPLSFLFFPFYFILTLRKTCFRIKERGREFRRISGLSPDALPLSDRFLPLGPSLGPILRGLCGVSPPVTTPSPTNLTHVKRLFFFFYFFVGVVVGPTFEREDPRHLGSVNRLRRVGSASRGRSVV